MIEFSHERPLLTEEIQRWVANLARDGASLNGWEANHLLQTLVENPYCYFLYQQQLAALISYKSQVGGPTEVLYLATSPSLRRLGCMSALLTAFKAHRCEQPLWLECRTDNQVALGMYLKSGFKLSGRRKSYYKDGMDAILLNF